MDLLWDQGVLSSSCAGSGELQEYLWGTEPPSPPSGCPSSLYSPGSVPGLPWKTETHNAFVCHWRLKKFTGINNLDFSNNRLQHGNTIVLTSLVQVCSCWLSHTCPAVWPGWGGPESAGVWSPAAPVLDAAASCWRVLLRLSVYSLSGHTA